MWKTRQHLNSSSNKMLSNLFISLINKLSRMWEEPNIMLSKLQRDNLLELQRSRGGENISFCPEGPKNRKDKNKQDTETPEGTNATT